MSDWNSLNQKMVKIDNIKDFINKHTFNTCEKFERVEFTNKGVFYLMDDNIDFHELNDLNNAFNDVNIVNIKCEADCICITLESEDGFQ